MMVGNSLKSDVVPAIEAGSWGVYIPTPSPGSWSTQTSRKRRRATAVSIISVNCRRFSPKSTESAVPAYRRQAFRKHGLTLCIAARGEPLCASVRDMC